MKRVLAVVFAFLVVVQLCLLPLAVKAEVNGFVCCSVVTLAATNITDSTATLNGSFSCPVGSMSNGLVLASLQHVSAGVRVSFKYGTVPGVYTAETEENVVTGSGGTFLANISGLSPCTTYYVITRRQGTQSTIFNQYGDGLKGAGVGLDYKNLQQLFNQPCDDTYGSVISFQTLGCQTFIGSGAPTSHGSSVAASTTYAPPVSLPNLVIQSASLSAKTVTPGTPITVTADIANKSAVNGNKKVTLYVNGQVETTQGITVNSGGSTKLTFNVSRSEPGDYTVYVDGVPAGSFKVEMVTGPDSILIFSAILVALAFLIGMVMLWRRQRAV